MIQDIEELVRANVCYLTTIGRITGKPHTIEIWFVLDNSKVYLLSGGMERSDWVKNITNQPHVTVKIKNEFLLGNGRIVSAGEEERLARKLMAEKYAGNDEELIKWSESALPIAIDLEA